MVTRSSTRLAFKSIPKLAKIELGDQMAPGARAACEALLFWFASVTYCFSGEGVSASGFFFLLNTPADVEIESSSRIDTYAFIAPSPANRLPQPSRPPVPCHRFVREIVFRYAGSAVESHRP